MDVTWCCRPPKTICCVSCRPQCPLDLSARGAWTRVLLLVLELWIIVGAMRAVVSCVHAEMCANSDPTCADYECTHACPQRRRHSGFPSRERHRTGAWHGGRACSRALGDTQVATVACLQGGKAVDGLVNVPRAWWTKVNQVMAHLGWIASFLESLPLEIHEERRTNPGPLLCSRGRCFGGTSREQE